VTLLDAKGNPIATQNFAKGPQPITGEAFAPRWAGDLDKYIFTMPGGGVVLFDLSKLTLADFRTMRDHYQVNACLAVMTFMLHQMDWKIECDNPKVATMVTENIQTIWTPMIRALSQAFWAGYSPNILQWENGSRYTELTKIKDLIPEECWVNWKTVDGYAPPGFLPPKIRVFDGIRTYGTQWPVPVENSLWYPLLMENGDYFGRKLLRPVFTSWYFSILVHLFSNRYFERFGEPVPVGRASYEEEITIPTPGGGTKKVLGADLMVQVLQNLRNRSVVVLPNDRTMIGNRSGANAVAYDYEIEYLESQMRGADFERYLMRLDEEISLGLFTPLLILRTADVGSYNLGSTHWNMYLNMLNAIAGDMKYFIDNFVLSRMVDYNFGTKAPRAKIIFRKMGDDRKDVVMALLQALMGGGTVKPDLDQLGDIAGLTFDEVKIITQPNGNPDNPAPTKTPAKTSPTKTPSTKKNSRAVVAEIATRTAAQFNKFVREGADGAVFEPSFGHERQLEVALGQDGATDPARIVSEVFRVGKVWMQEIPRDASKATDVLNASLVEEVLSSKIGDLLDGGW
jgi:hypothetical protein